MQIGTVTHFYNKIGVAVISLKASLSVGDKIKISGHDKEFIQEVVSIQNKHVQIKKAKKGDSIGLKVENPVKEGDIIFSVAE